MQIVNQKDDEEPMRMNSQAHVCSKHRLLTALQLRDSYTHTCSDSQDIDLSRKASRHYPQSTAHCSMHCKQALETNTDTIQKTANCQANALLHGRNRVVYLLRAARSLTKAGSTSSQGAGSGRMPLRKAFALAGPACCVAELSI